MSNDAKIFKTWEGFLPPNSIVMGKRIPGESVPPQTSKNTRLAKTRFVLSHALRGETNDLLLKILQAMNWSIGDLEITQEGEKSNDAPFTIRLTGGSQVGELTPKSLITYSLEEMLSEPKLKREVWSHLKSAQAYLS